MATKVILLAFTSGLLMQTAHVHIVARSAEPERVHLVQNGQKVDLQSQEAQVSVIFPTGKAGLLDVLTLWDPQSKLFWWTYQFSDPAHPGGIRERFLADSAVYLMKTKLVSFRGGIFMEVTESSERCASLGEGLAHVLAVLEEKRAKVEAGDVGGSLLINLGRSLDASFVHLRGNAAPYPQPKMRQVTRVDGQWRVVLDGPNGDSAVVLLDDKYEVISAKVLPPAAAK